MNKLQTLEAEHGENQRKIDALGALMDADKTRKFTEQERTDLDSWVSRKKELESEIDAEKLLASSRSLPIAIVPGAAGKGGEEGEKERSMQRYNLHEVFTAKMRGTDLKGVEGEFAQEVEKRAKEDGVAAAGFGVPVEYLNSMRSKNAANQGRMGRGDRAYSATGTTTESLDQGGQLIETLKPGLIDAFSDYMILDQMGIRKLTNLRGNLSLPKELTKAKAGWETETSQVDDQAGLFDTVDLSPKRLGGYVDYTMQMMTQPTIAIEPYVNDRLRYSLANAVQEAFFIGTGANNQPTGVLKAILATGLQSLGGQVIESAAAIDWDSIVDLETTVDINNALMGSLGYVMNSKVRGLLKTTAKGTSTNDHYLWNMSDRETPINGYAAWVTNHIPSTSTGTNLTGGAFSPLTFGNWNDAALANWGDVFVDLDKQYVGTGIYRMVVNSFWDVAVLRTKSFAMLNDLASAYYGGS